MADVSSIKPWHDASRETIAECRIFDVERSISISPYDQSEHEFYRVLSGDWVQVVPVTAGNEIVAVRQYRHGPSKLVLEIPGGNVDPGEQAEAAARRECLEETGYSVGELKSLGSVNPNPAVHDHQLHAYWATGAEETAEIQMTASEQTEVVLVPIAELPTRLAAGEFDHALVVATLWRFLYERFGLSVNSQE